MKAIGERLYNGIVKENPTFVLMLGMCPTLAVTTSAKNGIGMGAATMVVLILSNLMISLLRKIIPDAVRVPVYITIIASFVTVIEMVMHAYVKDLYESLGIYIPLIVVNCIILGRAESYANKNGPILSIFDGIGIGIGFTIGLTAIGMVRELLGAGTIFNIQIMPKSYEPVSIFIMAPGAFFVLAMLCALQNKLQLKGANRHVKGDAGCNGDCASCPMKEIEEKEAKNNG
ncbi:MAG: electron transport complex subunit E [Eubacterium sp.]|nr:electron transport complex subunit E [Eubacterium sp.]